VSKSEPHSWQLQEAKARFSALIKKAQDDGPQRITRHGEPIAVVVSRRDFESMNDKNSFLEFLTRSSLGEIEVPERDPRDVGRDVELP
jgi:prevent-host-death family protein